MRDQCCQAESFLTDSHTYQRIHTIQCGLYVFPHVCECVYIITCVYNMWTECFQSLTAPADRVPGRIL